MRTTQTLGAESAAITDLTTQTMHNALGAGNPSLHAVLWPTLLGAGLLGGAGAYSLRQWRRRRGARWRGSGGGLGPLYRSDGGGGGGGYSDRPAAGGGAAGVGDGGFFASAPGYGQGLGRRRGGGGGWWGALRGAVGGCGGGGGGAAAAARHGSGVGLPQVEVAFADLGASRRGPDGSGGDDGYFKDSERSPRDDSFAAILRMKQQQLLGGRAAGGAAGAGAARGHSGGGGGDADVRVDVDVSGRAPTSDSAASHEGPPSELADSATELERRT
jgi:hypothetical protein